MTRYYTPGITLSTVIFSCLLFTACGGSSGQSDSNSNNQNGNHQSSICSRIVQAGIPIPEINDGINRKYADTFDGNCAAFQQYTGTEYQSSVNGITTTIRQESNGDFVLIKNGTSTTGGSNFNNWVAFRYQSYDSGDIRGIFYYYATGSTDIYSKTTYYRDGRAHYDFSSSAPDTYYFPGQNDQRFITDFGYITIGANQIHNGYTVVTISNRVATSYLGCKGDLATLQLASATALNNQCNSNSAENL
ncbi:MAG: hypothetical protein LRY66_15415 [Saccharospirillaceae bacterium]|nr:hypothetical protein [Saccharospirillaceae bacterium]MCD8532694.1 hypothetical protein [Saccharospirillaceae bacterium]